MGKIPHVELFLRLNGWRFTADAPVCVLTVLSLAAGDLSQEAFATWLREHVAEAIAGSK